MTPLYAIFDPTHLGAALELEQSGTQLAVTAIADINRTALAIFPQSVGRWRAEVMAYGPGTLLASVGVATLDASLATYAGGDANGYGYRLDLGEIHNNGAAIDGSPGAPVASKGDIIGLLLDLTTTQPTITWYRQGTPVFTQVLPSTGPWAIAVSLGGSEAYGLRAFLNTGQRAFEFFPPTDEGWFEPPLVVRGLRLASEDWMSPASDDVPNARYSGLLAGDNSELRAVRSLDFWPWQRGVQTGAMVLSAYDAEDTFAEILAGDARDLPMRISSIDSGQSYADRVSLFSAVIDGVTAVDDLTVKLTCRDPLGLLGVPLQRALIRPDAEPSAANTPRPIVLGACRNVPAVLTDRVALAYAVSDAPILGIGYVRDSGYPLDPAAVPADFALDATRTGLLLHAEPTGKITADISSVGGDQLPQPADDILNGAGDPFTGTNGAPPDGFDSAGGDVPQATPQLSGGLLQFPLTQVAPTVYVALPIYTSNAIGSVAVRISWLSDVGNVITTTEGTRVTGTHAWSISELVDTAPPDALNARIEVAAYDHTGGVIRVGGPDVFYVTYGAHTDIGLQNPTFDDGLNHWTADGAGWSQESTTSIDGTDYPQTVAYFSGSAISGLTNDGIQPVTLGQRITATCQAALYTTGGGRPGAELLLLWFNAADQMIKFDRSGALTKGNKGRFSQLTCTGTAPAGATYAKLKLSANNPSGSSSSGPRFDACAWSFALSPTLGDKLPINLGDFSDASKWQLGVGWSLEPAGVNGPDGDPYAEHAPGAAVTSLLKAARTANVRQAVAYAGWLGIGAAKFGAGKSYKVRIVITDMPDDGASYVGLATGTTLDTMIALWKAPGTYTVTITNTDGVDHPLYLLAVPFSAGAGSVPIPPTIGSLQIIEYDDTYNPDPISLVPATLQAIALADYVHEVLDVRAAGVGASWSVADAAAIDTATGYAGVGVYLAGGETIAQALDVALASYTACKWCDGDGVIRIARMIAPESVASGDRAGTIDINALDGDLVPMLDTAPGLTTQMGVRRNWAALSDGDLVAPSTNFPLAVRQSMLRAYQQTASSAKPLAGAYRHALYAPPVASCFDQQADGQAEIDRICAIYGTARWFYAGSVFLDALPALDLGQVWTLVYPKYGLASGKPVMVIDYQPDLLAGTANIILWG
ncbi:MAG: SPRY domain-containing protein [Rhodanobacter sp.]